MRFIVLAGLVLLAVIGSFAFLKLAAPSNPQATATATASAPNQVNTVEVLVARQPIEVGTIVDESMIDKQPWPEHLVADGFVTTTSRTNLVGMVARSSIQAREPFLLSKLANPNDANFMAASLAPGMRAVTIGTDAVTGVAGYLFPGDRVDVVLTHSVPEKILARSLGTDDAEVGEFGGVKLAPDGSRAPGAGVGTNLDPIVSEVLVSNVRVLAVNVRTNVSKEGQSSVSLTPTNVSLEIPKADVQRVRLAEKNGTLSLSLRPLQDAKDIKAQADIGFPTGLKDITRVEPDLSQSKMVESVTIVRGATPVAPPSTYVPYRAVGGESPFEPVAEPAAEAAPVAAEGAEVLENSEAVEVPAAVPQE